MFRNKISSVLRLSYILCYWFIHRNHDGRPILPINVTVLPHISSSRSFRIWLKYVATSLDKTCHLIVVYISIVGKYQKMDGNMAAAASFYCVFNFIINLQKGCKKVGSSTKQNTALPSMNVTTRHISVDSYRPDLILMWYRILFILYAAISHSRVY